MKFSEWWLNDVGVIFATAVLFSSVLPPLCWDATWWRALSLYNMPLHYGWVYTILESIIMIESILPIILKRSARTCNVFLRWNNVIGEILFCCVFLEIKCILSASVFLWQHAVTTTLQKPYYHTSHWSGLAEEV